MLSTRFNSGLHSSDKCITLNPIIPFEEVGVLLRVLRGKIFKHSTGGITLAMNNHAKIIKLYGLSFLAEKSVTLSGKGKQFRGHNT